MNDTMETNNLPSQRNFTPSTCNWLIAALFWHCFSFMLAISCLFGISILEITEIHCINLSLICSLIAISLIKHSLFAFRSFEAPEIFGIAWSDITETHIETHPTNLLYIIYADLKEHKSMTHMMSLGVCHGKRVRNERSVFSQMTSHARSFALEPPFTPS